MLEFIEHHPTPTAVISTLVICLMPWMTSDPSENYTDKRIRIPSDTTCANQLFNDSLAVDVLKAFKDGSFNREDLDGHELDGLVGAPTGSEQVAVVRKGKCFGYFNVSSKFAVIYAGSAVKMPPPH
jgi:hypothetical protein